MSTVPYIRQTAASIDLSSRVVYSVTVAASPSAGTETTVATLTIPTSLAVASGVHLFGYAAFTVGTSGVSANLKIRQTDTSGSTIAATGATTVTATNLKTMTVMGVDTAATLPGQVYVLSLLIGSGAATSTVSAVYLCALVV